MQGACFFRHWAGSFFQTRFNLFFSQNAAYVLFQTCVYCYKNLWLEVFSLECGYYNHILILINSSILNNSERNRNMKCYALHYLQQHMQTQMQETALLLLKCNNLASKLKLKIRIQKQIQNSFFSIASFLCASKCQKLKRLVLRFERVENDSEHICNNKNMEYTT